MNGATLLFLILACAGIYLIRHTKKIDKTDMNPEDVQTLMDLKRIQIEQQLKRNKHREPKR